VAKDKEDEKKRKAHTPGRDHTRKSGPQKKKRFQKKAAKKRKAKTDDLRRQWAEWDCLPPDVQRLRPELEPKEPRPPDES
jgi:hypothetical protein